MAILIFLYFVFYIKIHTFIHNPTLIYLQWKKGKGRIKSKIFQCYYNGWEAKIYFIWCLKLFKNGIIIWNNLKHWKIILNSIILSVLLEISKLNFKNIFELYSPKVEVLNHNIWNYGHNVQCEWQQFGVETTESSNEVRKNIYYYVFYFPKLLF